MTMPDNSNLIDVIRPPKLANNKTPKEATIAPIKAPKATPICANNAPLPTPKRITNVAPKEAPDEIPKI